jgi:hypothetical protein
VTLANGTCEHRRQHRSALFLAVLSKDMPLISHLLRTAPGYLLEARDKLWGWNVLHAAASTTLDDDDDLCPLLSSSYSNRHHHHHQSHNHQHHPQHHHHHHACGV